MADADWTVSIDPGLRGSGIAVFDGTALYTAWYSKSPNKHDRGPTAWAAMARSVEQDWLARIPRRLTRLSATVAEVPQVYWFGGGGGRRGGNAADLIELAGVVGAITFGLPASRRHHFLPREWKGQVPKEVHNPRVLAALTDAERSAIEPIAQGLAHNVIDAVGLGLVHLGRLPRPGRSARTVRTTRKKSH